MIGSTTYNWYWLILEIWALRPVQWNGTTSLKKIFLNILNYVTFNQIIKFYKI